MGRPIHISTVGIANFQALKSKKCGKCKREPAGWTNRRQIFIVSKKVVVTRCRACGHLQTFQTKGE